MKAVFQKIKFSVRWFLFRLGLALMGAVVFGLLYLDKRVELRRDIRDYAPVAQAAEAMSQREEEDDQEKEFSTFGKLTPELVHHLCKESERKGISCAVSLAIAQQETGGDPWLGSSAGAIGLMQVMPQTARTACPNIKGPNQLWDVRSNIECGVSVLDYCLRTYKGDLFKALYCYNGSPACQEKCRNENRAVVCINMCAETYHYARAVISKMNQLRREAVK